MTTTGICLPPDNYAAEKPAPKPLQVDPLPVVGSFANLKALLQEAERTNRLDFGYREIQPLAPRMAKSADAVFNEASSAATDYSGTNLQVTGVDEADIVKTDGKYIYQVSNHQVNVIQAYPAADMKKAASVAFNDQNFRPTDIYVDGTRLIILGSSSRTRICPSPTLKPSVRPPYRNFNTTRAIIYDTADKNNIQKVREVDLEGSYVSSRKVDNALYLVANRYVDYYALEDSDAARPSYRDTARSTIYQTIDYPSIHYFPGVITPNYMLVAGIRLDDSSLPADIQTYLGAGENIYASTHNLYVAVSNYSAKPVPMERIPQYQDTSATRTYRFALEQGRIKYTGTGEVPGTIINQFSMDENGECFRIATTSGEIWRSDQNTSQNNVYVLDKDMQIRGRLEGIAPGEKIYSTRFMGNRLYMVTFRNVDPLFVIDLKDPGAPRILGKLKIPGYSNYLHPYDENHIIGFGKDTVEGKGWNGQSQAYYHGMKIALFDVSDVSQPVQMFQEIIGDRGTDSELLHNHKALLFSREKKLLAFPVTVAKITPNDRRDGITDYGSFAFQGAYIYNIDLSQGLKLKGSITHLSADDYLRAGSHWYDDHKNVERVLYIDNTLYTISRSMIKAHQLSNLQEIKTLPL